METSATYKILLDKIDQARKAGVPEQEIMEQSFKEILKYASSNANQIYARMGAQFVSCNVHEKSLTLKYQVSDWQLNPSGNFHGGMIMTAVDSTMGTLTRYYAGAEHTPTVNMSVNFIRGVPLGEDLYVTAYVKQYGRNIISLSAEATLGSSGKLAVTALATFYSLSEIRK